MVATWSRRLASVTATYTYSVRSEASPPLHPVKKESVAASRNATGRTRLLPGSRLMLGDFRMGLLLSNITVRPPGDTVTSRPCPAGRFPVPLRDGATCPTGDLRLLRRALLGKNNVVPHRVLDPEFLAAIKSRSQ